MWKAGLYPELGAALADRIRAQKKELGRRGGWHQEKKKQPLRKRSLVLPWRVKGS